MSELRKTYEGGLFFVTLTVVGWVDVFTRPAYVEELVKNLKHCQDNKGLELYAYVLMRNVARSSHLHLIAARAQGDLTELLGRFKSTTSKKLLRLIAQHEHESRREWLLYLFEYFAKPLKQQEKYQFWQKTNHPTGLWSPAVVRQKVEYIHMNPVVAGLVSEPEHYRFSSAHPQGPLTVLPL